jgi:putative PIN family toxin of toxin-antitoxin system
MGQKKKIIPKMVLDTNVLVSALLFIRGSVSKMVDLWKAGRIKPVFSRATFQEFKMVLTYPKFALTPDEILNLLEEEVLPYFEVVKVIKEVKGTCRDPGDDMFLSCALASEANFIVTGDEDLLVLDQFATVRIINPAEFVHYLESTQVPIPLDRP